MKSGVWKSITFAVYSACDSLSLIFPEGACTVLWYVTISILQSKFAIRQWVLNRSTSRARLFLFDHISLTSEGKIAGAVIIDPHRQYPRNDRRDLETYRLVSSRLVYYALYTNASRASQLIVYTACHRKFWQRPTREYPVGI